MAKCAIAEVIAEPGSFAILELDHTVFCHAAREQMQVERELETILDVFCFGQDKERHLAGVLLGDLFRAQLVPLKQEVSKHNLTCKVFRKNPCA